MKTNIYQEICCDSCNDTIHNHFDCPECNTERGYQGTDQYSYIHTTTLEIQCEECKTKFKRVNEDDYWYKSDIEITYSELNKIRDNIINKIINE